MSTSSSLDAQSSVLLHVVRNIRAKCLARVRPAEVHCTVLDRLLEELYSALQNFNNLNFGSATTTDLCERCFTSITHGLRETLVGIQDEFDGFGRDDGQRELSREDRAARLDYREVPETIGDFAAQLRLLSQSLDRPEALTNPSQTARDAVDRLHTVRDALYGLLAEGRPGHNGGRTHITERPALCSDNVEITTVRGYSASLILEKLEEQHKSAAEKSHTSTWDLRSSIHWYAQAYRFYKSLDLQSIPPQSGSKAPAISSRIAKFLTTSLRCWWLAQRSLEDQNVNFLLLHTSSIAACSIVAYLNQFFSARSVEWGFEDLYKHDSFTLQTSNLKLDRRIPRPGASARPPLAALGEDSYFTSGLAPRTVAELPATHTRSPPLSIWRMPVASHGLESPQRHYRIRSPTPQENLRTENLDVYEASVRGRVLPSEDVPTSRAAPLSRYESQPFRDRRDEIQNERYNLYQNRDTQNYDVTPFQSMTLHPPISRATNTLDAGRAAPTSRLNSNATELPVLRSNEVEISSSGVQDSSPGLSEPFGKGVDSFDSEPLYSSRWCSSKIYVFKGSTERGEFLRLWTTRASMPHHEIIGLLAEVELVPYYAFRSAGGYSQEIHLRSGGMQFGLKYRFTVASGNQQQDTDEFFAFQSALMSASLECEYPVAEIILEGSSSSSERLRPARMQLWVEDKCWSNCSRQSDSSSGSSDSKMVLRRDQKVPFHESFEDFEGAKVFLYSNSSIYVILVTDRIVLRTVAGNTLKLSPNRRISCSFVQVRKLQGTAGAVAGIPLDQSGLQFSDLDGANFTSYKSVTIKFLGQRDSILEDFRKEFQTRIDVWIKRRSKAQSFRDNERNLRLRSASELHRHH